MYKLQGMMIIEVRSNNIAFPSALSLLPLRAVDSSSILRAASCAFLTPELRRAPRSLLFSSFRLAPCVSLLCRVWNVLSDPLCMRPRPRAVFPTAVLLPCCSAAAALFTGHQCHPVRCRDSRVPLHCHTYLSSPLRAWWFRPVCAVALWSVDARPGAAWRHAPDNVCTCGRR